MLGNAAFSPSDYFYQSEVLIEVFVVYTVLVFAQHCPDSNLFFVYPVVEFRPQHSVAVGLGWRLRERKAFRYVFHAPRYVVRNVKAQTDALVFVAVVRPYHWVAPSGTKTQNTLCRREHFSRFAWRPTLGPVGQIEWKQLERIVEVINLRNL